MPVPLAIILTFLSVPPADKSRASSDSTFLVNRFTNTFKSEPNDFVLVVLGSISSSTIIFPLITASVDFNTKFWLFSVPPEIC